MIEPSDMVPVGQWASPSGSRISWQPVLYSRTFEIMSKTFSFALLVAFLPYFGPAAGQTASLERGKLIDGKAQSGLTYHLRLPERGVVVSLRQGRPQRLGDLEWP